VALRRRFEVSSRPSDLDDAIEAIEVALQGIPTDDPRRADFLALIGLCWYGYFQFSALDEYKELAVAALESVLDTSAALPFTRIFAGRISGRLLAETPRRARHPLKLAVKLLPNLNPPTLSRKNQQHNASETSGLASLAASISLASDDAADEALELLELGRGVMATLRLNLRSDISALEAANPALADQFLYVRDQLNSSTTESLTTHEAISNAQSHRNIIGRQFDDLLSEIRCLSGFERFLLAPPESELKKLAQDGPIILFNVSEIRSDALIVTTEGVDCMHLPALHRSSVEKHAEIFLDAVSNFNPGSFAQSNRKLKEVLEWLWDAAVGPVLDALHFGTPPTNGEWPRVWWIGSSLLNILPIHAAGYHDGDELKTAIGRVISSYTPTLKCLQVSRELVKKFSDLSSQNAILVGMPTTPDQCDLPFVSHELQCLEQLFSSNIHPTVMRNPTKEETTAVLPQQQIVHLSCHGMVSTADPSQSSLLLEDWRTNPLTVSDIVSLTLSSAQFAFLSSCHSASSRDLKLLDESINLASAFQLAGFPSVIGTLWQVTDSDSANVAQDVYQEMFGSEGKLEIHRAAEALHHSIRRLREKLRRRAAGFSNRQSDVPLLWAAFVHLGI